MQTRDTAFPFTLDLGSNGGRHLFKNLSDLKAWVKEETDAWAWFSSSNLDHNRLPRLSHTKNGLQQFQRTINQHLASIETLLSEDKPAIKELQNLKADIERHYGFDVVNSRSAAGKFILSHKDNPEYAAYLYSFIRQGGNGNLNHSVESRVPVLRAHIEAFLFENAILKKTPQNIAEQLESMRASWDKQFEEYSRNINDIMVRSKQDFENLRNDIHVDKARYKESYDELLKQQQEEEQKRNKETKKEYEDIVHKFKTAMALKAPVTYWDRKAKSHRWLAVLPILALASLFAVFGCFYSEITLAGVKDKLIPADKTGYGEILILGVAITLIIWLLRILVKLFLSQLHLASEASERKVIVQTFLALLEDNAIESKEKELVLAAIFRPSSTGIVTDDSPATFWDLLGKIAGGGKS